MNRTPHRITTHPAPPAGPLHPMQARRLQTRRDKLDLKQHLLRQMAFSHATFGPGERTAGVIDHIRKELVEVETANGDSSEWVDVVILALDGLTRRLAFCNGDRNNPESVAEMACGMIRGKQARNEARTWPEWRTADPNKAIEHDREAAQ